VNVIDIVTAIHFQQFFVRDGRGPIEIPYLALGHSLSFSDMNFSCMSSPERSPNLLYIVDNLCCVMIGTFLLSTITLKELTF
jgi:hypothetical protein